MDPRIQPYMKKENIQMAMVLILSLVLIFVLKARMTKKVSVPSPSSSVQTEGSMALESGTAGQIHRAAPSDSRSVTRRAGRNPLRIADAPATLRRDLFSPSNPAYDPLELDQGTRPGAAGGWVLEAILLNSRTPLAIISGQVVGIGDKIGQSEVIDITEDRVTLSSGGREQVMTLEKDPSS